MSPEEGQLPSRQKTGGGRQCGPPRPRGHNAGVAALSRNQDSTPSEPSRENPRSQHLMELVCPRPHAHQDRLVA